MPTPTTSLLESLQWRYATKSFDPTKKISETDWHVLEESLRLAPSSFGLQPWKFFVIQNPEVRKTLLPLSWNQSQIEACSHLVVITALKTITKDYITHYVQHIANTRHIPVEGLAGYQDMMVTSLLSRPQETLLAWAQRQAYIALGGLLYTAAALEIDSCPIEGFDPKGYDQVLSLENTPYTSSVVAALGYRDAKDHYQHLEKVRFDRDSVFSFV